MKKLFVCFILLLGLNINFAQATPIEFSFVDDPTDFPWIVRDHTPGIVTGLIYGLSENGNDLLPTSLEFTSDVSALGITNNVINSFTAVGGTGFDLSGGSIIDANLLLNFNDPVIGGMQIRFNYDNWNVLHWNGSSGPLLAMGNQNGFSGANYGAASVPEPASMAMLALGLAGIGFARRKGAA